MITKEQLLRVEQEFLIASNQAFEKARVAERMLEDYTYSSARTYDPVKREKLLDVYNQADYEAESRALILVLLRKHMEKYHDEWLSVR